MAESHTAGYYVKIYIILLVLFLISLLGPELGIPIVTLITAFGIAVVKAYMVAAYFMHLNIEKKFIHYMLYTMILLMLVFVGGTAADIFKPTGSNWENAASLEIIERHKEAAPKEH